MFSSLFFFKQKTAYEMRISDWSSDVCSSDLFTGSTVPAGLDSRMADDKTGRREKGCPSAAGKSGVMKRNSNEKTADLNDWLNEELHALYDPILEEPIQIGRAHV